MTTDTSPSPATSAPSLYQIIGATPISQIWALILAVAAAVSGVAVASFAFGKQIGETSAQKDLVVVSAQLGKAQAETVVQTERAKRSDDALKQYVDYASRLNAQIAARDKQIVALNEQLGRIDTCAFLQQQIASIQERIAIIRIMRPTPLHMAVSGPDSDSDSNVKNPEDDTEVTQLQQQLLGFTQQLNICAR